MKIANCHKHGQFWLSPHTLPECPECIKERFVFPDAEDPKHAPTDASTVKGFRSFRSDQISADAIFNYMAYNNGAAQSGCNLYYYPKEKSFNAISLEPCGLIPGSGAKNGTATAARFALLQDITGKSAKGPHFAYEDVAHFEKRLADGEWTEAPKCIKCNEIYVYVSGTQCLACSQGT